MEIPPPLCQHPADQFTRHGSRAVCGVCGSFWDLDSLRARVTYDASYPEHRGHFDPRIGALKVRTLAHWVRASGIELAGKTVCEVGFGGGATLGYLAERAAHVIGLEINETAIAHVRAQGIRAELLNVVPLPDLSRKVDLWLFEDSFEHIPDPAAFMAWMDQHSAPNAEILMVLPRGDSLSRKLMGRFWPHKLPDHEFHWSLRGLLSFLDQRGYQLVRQFFPLKFASPGMVAAHFLHKLGIGAEQQRKLTGASFAIPINFGEQGLRLRRR